MKEGLAPQVGFKHQKDCRHVVLAVADPVIRAIAVNQRTLHSRTLPVSAARTLPPLLRSWPT